MKKRAILFDLDGTLLDTLDDLADAMNSVLVRLGFPVHPREAYKHFVGDGISELVVRALPSARKDADTIAQCLDFMRTKYAACWALKTHPYKQISELLAALHSLGITMTVLSNKPHAITGTMIQHYFPDVAFAEVRGFNEGTPRKPDPTAALEIAENSGIKTEEFVYLGDTNTDMQTAKAAGMQAIGALWGFRTKEELIASGAEIVIENPMEILNVFKM
jgi:phosphoglycolate phosphatase